MAHQALQQHDLIASAAQTFVEGARLNEGDMVLEIGPGHGALTAAMLAVGARVRAVERDPQRAAALRREFEVAIEAERLQVLCGDAVDLHPAMELDWRVLSNPPFQLTSVLLRRWLLEDLPGAWPSRIDLIIQMEAARRLCGSRSYGLSRLGVLCRLFGKPRLVRRLSREAVEPPSRVDLAIWSLSRRPRGLKPTDLRLVDRLLEIAFAGPHSLKASLSGLATSQILRRQAAKHGYDPENHPRQVPVEAWLDLARHLQKIGRL